MGDDSELRSSYLRMCSALWWLSLLLCLFSSSFSYSFPDESFLDRKVSEKSVIHLQKTMKPGGYVYARVYCGADSRFHIHWFLMNSQCLGAFASTNTAEIFQKSRFILASEYSYNITYKTNETNMTCIPTVPSLIEGDVDIHWKTNADTNTLPIPQKHVHGLLSTTWQSGVYLFAVEIACISQNCPDLRVNLEFRNQDGRYLSAVDYPLLPFNGLLSTIYFLLGITWLLLTTCFWHQLTRIQLAIGLLLLLGLWEHLTLTAVYATVERSGTVSMLGVYLAELVACIKRAVARILVLIVCLGYGVTRHNLGQVWFRRCLFIGMAYFFLVTVEGLTRVSEPRFQNSVWLLATLFPLLFVDFGIMWWIFIHLAHTLRETRVRYHPVKYRLYRNFSYILAVVCIASIAFMVFSIHALKNRACIKHWNYLWLDEAYWQVLFVVIMTAIMVLWRPTSLNRHYAYSLLDETGDADEAVDVLFDCNELEPDNEVRIRALQKSRTVKDSDTKKEEQPIGEKTITGYSVHSPPSATAIELLGIEASSGPNSSTPDWKTS